MENKLLRYALRYAKLGYHVLPLKPRDKTPLTPLTPHGLHDATTDPDIIRDWWERWPNANVGLRTGPESGFFVLDIDGAEGELSLEALEMKNGELSNTRQSRTGGGGRHILFKYQSHPVKNFNDGRLGKGLDVRGEGGYIVAPPSIHSSGNAYEWIGDPPSPIADAPEWLLEKLAQGKTAKASPATNGQARPGKIRQGGRHQALLSYAGKLRYAGADESEILAALQVFNEESCHPPKALAELETIARDVATRYAPGLAAESAWPTLRKLPARIPVHTCPLEALPSAIGDWASDVAERFSVPVDLPVAAIIVNLSAAIGRRARVQPKRRDTAYLVVPNLWGVMIAPPGSKKSPVINAAKRSLQQIDKRWRLEYEQARQSYEAELAALKLKSRQPAAERAEPEGPREPRRRHALLNDATAEALHKELATNPAGVLVLRDELPGWLGGLEKQAREGDRCFWLETWSGDGDYHSVRIARGATDADALCVSLFGGVQPGPWMEYAAKAPADGMLQRFQIMVWPDPLPKVQLVDRAPNQAAEERIEAIFECLIGMPVEPSLRLRFSDDAQQLHDVWLLQLEVKIAQGDDRPAFTNHLAKYRSLMPSLACIFELIENVNAQSIGLDAARRAAAFCEYLESHAERSYQARTDSTYEAARTLGEKIEAGALGSGGRFSLREVYRPQWTGLNTPAEARAACEVLTDYGWIRPLPARPGSGRPSETFEVNPAVYR